MRKYEVSPTEYFDGLLSAPEQSNQGYGFARNVPASEKAISELCERYAIRRKHILSLGCSFGFEEYWFEKFGNKLTLLDIDESAIIAGYLETLPVGSGLTYLLGDARDLLPEGKCDVLYTSSFTPDEWHRKNLNRTPGLVQRLFRKLGFSWAKRTWPVGALPASPLLLSASEKLREEGLLIVQSYAWGPLVTHNPHYVACWRAQLADHGIVLLDAYHFHANSAVVLLVGYKGSAQNAALYHSQLKKDLTTFHGRSSEALGGVSHFFHIT